jgi:hypothetical protein
MLASDTTTKIVNGPTKFDLVVAFADRFGQGSGTGARQRSVTFTTSLKFDGNDNLDVVAEIVIDSLAWEDGSGQNFLFRGHLCRGSSYRARLGTTEVDEVHGYYNTKRHAGWIQGVSTERP